MESLRAIWRCWEQGEKLDFHGDHYNFTLMTPEFSPKPNGYRLPPLSVAAVGPDMLRMAGRIADGARLHGFCTRKYIEDVCMARIGAGLEAAGQKRENLALADAVTRESDHPWATKVQAAATRAGAEVSQHDGRELQEADGLIGRVNDGERAHRIAVGTGEFMAGIGVAINPQFVETKLLDIPDALAMFVAIDGHVAGTIWMTEPIRQTLQGAIRSVRAGGHTTRLSFFAVSKRSSRQVRFRGCF